MQSSKIQKTKNKNMASICILLTYLKSQTEDELEYFVV